VIRKTYLTISSVLFLSFFICSCGSGSGSAQDATFSRNSEVPQNLELHTATLGSATLKIMLARSAEEKRIGLMFWENLPDDEGMLFVYDSPQIMRFWMKNTKIPLDIVFFSSELSVTEFILGMVPGYGLNENTLPIYSSKAPAQYALELASGTVNRLGIRPGMKLVLPLTLLFETSR